MNRVAVNMFFLSGVLMMSLLGLATALSGSLLFGLLAALAVAFAWTRPAWVLLAVVAIAPVSRSLYSAVLPPENIVYAKATIMLLTGGIAAARWGLMPRDMHLPGSTQAFLLLWSGLIALATLNAQDPILSLTYLPVSAAGAAAFVMSFYLDRRRQNQLLWGILGIGGAIGLLVLLQYVVVTYNFLPFLARIIIEPRTQAYYTLNPMSGISNNHYRPSGTMMHPNSMGVYFAVLIPFACALLGTRTFSRRVRLILAGVLGLMAIGLLATNSRGASVALVVALVYLSWHVGYRWLAGWGMAGFLAITTVFYFSGERESLKQAFLKVARVEYGMSGRTTIWENASSLVRQDPILGVGPANLSAQYVDHFGFFIPNSVQEQMSQIWAIQNLSAQKVVENFHAHNIYLQLAGEVGVFGPLLFLCGLLWLLIQAERGSRIWPRYSLPRALCLAVGSFAVVLFIYGFFDSQYAFTVDSVNLVAAPLVAISLKRGRLANPIGEKAYGYHT